MATIKNRIWLITDTHLNHKNIVSYCNRPRNCDEMVLDAFQEILKDDILIHLGDVCVGEDTEAYRHFNKFCKCKKVLVKGNHDKKSNGWYYDHGWNFVCDSFADRYFGKWILFSHKPKGVPQYIDWNIHGHFHNTKIKDLTEASDVPVTAKHKLLCLEDEKYKPILLDKFLRRERMV